MWIICRSILCYSHRVSCFPSHWMKVCHTRPWGGGWVSRPIISRNSYFLDGTLFIPLGPQNEDRCEKEELADNFIRPYNPLTLINSAVKLEGMWRECGGVKLYRAEKEGCTAFCAGVHVFMWLPQNSVISTICRSCSPLSFENSPISLWSWWSQGGHKRIWAALGSLVLHPGFNTYCVTWASYFNLSAWPFFILK